MKLIELVMKEVNKEIYPPVANWSYPTTEKMCGIVQMFASKAVQRELLKNTKDILFVPRNMKDWMDEYAPIYIKLNKELSNLILKLSSNTLHYFKKNNCFLQLEEGDYLKLGWFDEGNPLRGIKSYFSADGRLSDIKEYYTDKEKIYDYLERNGTYYSSFGIDRTPVKNLIDKLLSYVEENQTFNKIVELYDIAFNTMKQTYFNIENEEILKRNEREVAEAARINSYIEWIEGNNPVYSIFGFSWKGASYTRISKEDAIKEVKEKKPYEISFKTINNEKALVLQYYGENDFY